MNEFRFGTKWRWAGVIVQDEEGNLIAWQIERPQGTVRVSQEMRGEYQGWAFHEQFGFDMVTKVSITLEGDATDWDQARDAAPGDHTPRNVGLIGHPDSGKTALGDIIRSINERPMLPPSRGDRND